MSSLRTSLWLWGYTYTHACLPAHLPARPPARMYIYILIHVRMSIYIYTHYMCIYIVICMLFCPHHHRVIGCFVKAIHDRLWPTSQVRGLGRGTHVVGLRTGLGSGLAVDSLRGTRPWTAFVELGRKRREVAQSLQGGRGSYQCRYQSTLVAEPVGRP